MGTAESRSAVDRVLAAHLADLSEGPGPSSGHASRVGVWRLPEADKAALLSHGLPPDRQDEFYGIVGRVQESEGTDRGPDGRHVYRLASYGTARLVAVEGSGEVLALPATTEVHPDLAHLHPRGIAPALVNSKTAAFVECAWRWNSLVSILAQEQERAGENEISAWKSGQLENLDDPYSEYQELCAYVLRRFQEIDPGIDQDRGFWSDVIIDVS